MSEQQVFNETFYGNHAIEELIELELKDIKSQIDKVEASIKELRANAFNDEYWDSKNTRINSITTSSEQLAYLLALFTAGRIGTVQEVIPRLIKYVKHKEMQWTLDNVGDIINCGKDLLYSLDGENFESFFELENETVDSIKLKQYLPPMVSKPLDWKSNDDGGLYTVNNHCILGGKLNHHNDTQALDALNILQSIEWELDSDVINYQEEPNKELSVQGQEQFLMLKETSRKVYKEYANKRFYFEWRFDKRGRQYSSGYHINLQSTKYKKSLLSFSKKELIEGEL